ncbi:MAG TPA: LysM peptidoglycan-binding domain-containing protein [Rhabdochlamydiaceae bacterium]|nr:LysM peptidoglycan-binding domain-containing protein [Rhabdochlamydiaceae bacterium]
MKKWLFLCTPFIWGCTSQLATLSGNKDHVIEEMRTEIADLRHAVHGAEVEIKLLEDRLEAQDLSKDDKKIAALEKTVEKMSADLRSLMAYATQTTASLSQYRDRITELDRKLEEIGKLRSTLSQISRSSQEKIYRVKPGDSLEKIARQHSISIEALKRENNLNSDRINIGQELKIPQ